MNNHGIICKNNIMIIFLIFIISFILILLNKKIKIGIDFSIIGFEYNFCININYFFDLITIYKEDFLKYRKKVTEQKKASRKIGNYKWILKYINIDRIILDVKIGLEDVFVTSMFIPVISTILAIVLEQYAHQSTKNFAVKPVYNKLFFSLKNVTYISIKAKDVIYIIYKIWRGKNKIVE